MLKSKVSIKKVSTVLFICMISCLLGNGLAFCSMVGDYNIALLNIDYVLTSTEKGMQIAKDLKLLSANSNPKAFESKKTEIVSSFVNQAKECVYSFAKSNNYDLLLDDTALIRLKSGKNLSKEEILYYSDASIQEILKYFSSVQGRSVLARSNIENVTAMVSAELDGKKSVQKIAQNKQQSNLNEPGRVWRRLKPKELPQMRFK